MSGQSDNEGLGLDDNFDLGGLDGANDDGLMNYQSPGTGENQGDFDIEKMGFEGGDDFNMMGDDKPSGEQADDDMLGLNESPSGADAAQEAQTVAKAEHDEVEPQPAQETPAGDSGSAGTTQDAAQLVASGADDGMETGLAAPEEGSKDASASAEPTVPKQEPGTALALVPLNEDEDDGPREVKPGKKGRKRVVDDDDEESEGEEEPEDSGPVDPRLLTPQTHTIIIPLYALWFSMKRIHKIERETNAEFFEGNHPLKLPKIYVNYRNFMINAYRLNPNEYLTLTSCRRNLVGDVGTLMRVHRFLNKWGLINYQVKPQYKPGFVDSKGNNGQQVGLPYAGDYIVKYDTPRGLFPFDTFKVNPDRIDVAKIAELVGGNPKELASTEAPKEDDDFSDLMNLSGGSKRTTPEQEEPPKGDVDITKRRKVSPACNWSTAEVDTLTQAVKEHRNDWYKIAEVVGGDKTPQDCILKFLQIPIDDHFNEFSNGAGSGDRVDRLLRYAPNYPVLAADNPVMLVLAFVSQLVDPEVAKAASEAARDAIEKSIKEQLKKEDDVKMEDGSKTTNGSATLPPSTESATAATLGVLGARLHLFATYEEREMNKHAATIVKDELAKIETKLAKVDELQTIYERERKNLQRQQEEVFIDRIALAKLTVGVTKKLEAAIKLLEAKDSAGDVSLILSEAKQLLFKPHKQSLTVTSKGDSLDNNTPAPEAAEATAASAADEEDKMKPLSVKAPQAFQVWAP